jgi:hypothetical protein
LALVGFEELESAEGWLVVGAPRGLLKRIAAPRGEHGHEDYRCSLAISATISG